MGEVLPLGRPGVHQVNVCVDHPREHEQARRVDDGSRRLEVARGNDSPPGHSKVGEGPPKGRDDHPALDDEIEVDGPSLLIR